MKVKRARMVAAAALLGACSGPPEAAPAPLAVSRALPAGVVATVGTQAIDQSVVARVAAARALTPALALEGEIFDTLLASAAPSRGIDGIPSVSAAIRGRLARARLEELYRNASLREPTDSEVEEATARHFIDLDRPEAFRVIHAVVKVPSSAGDVQRSRAKALAERIAIRVESATDEAAFRERAESTPDRGDLELLVESLSPVASDGRVIDVAHHSAEVETYVPEFARAAARLRETGQKSGVVETTYGFHVMMLLERLPPHVVPLDERRRLLRDEIANERAKEQKKTLVEELRRGSAIAIPRSVEALLATVPVSDDESR